MQRNELRSLRAALDDSRPSGERRLSAQHASVRLDELKRGTCLGAPIEELQGRSVLLLMRDPLAAGVALIELDGVARRLILCPPDLDLEYLPQVIATGEVDTVASDRTDVDHAIVGGRPWVSCHTDVSPSQPAVL